MIPDLRGQLKHPPPDSVDPLQFLLRLNAGITREVPGILSTEDV